MPKISLTVIAALLQLSWVSLYLRQSVRSELAEMQAKSGTTLVLFDSRWTGAVDFQQRTAHRLRLSSPEATDAPGAVSPDGNRIAFGQKAPGAILGVLAVASTDGKMLQVFADITAPYHYCWSSDGKWLATVIGPGDIEAIEIDSGRRQRVAKGHLSYPCWSADNQQLVYFEAEPARVMLFDFSSGISRMLVQGSHPTWSPDGRWIAYWHAGKHRLISPATGEQRVVMKDDSGGPLHWSPDSRFVSYLSRPSFMENVLTLFDPVPGFEELRLRVRRIEDGSDDWVVRLASKGPQSLDHYWVVGADRFRKDRQLEAPDRSAGVERACTPQEGSSIIRVDERNRRVFVHELPERLRNSEQASAVLAVVAQYVGMSHSSWGNEWAASFFAEREYAGYKDEGKLLPYVENGRWAAAYVAEYNHRAGRLTLYPAVPGQRKSLFVLPAK